MSVRIKNFLLHIPKEACKPLCTNSYFNTLKHKIYCTSVFAHIFKDTTLFTDPPRYKSNIICINDLLVISQH